MYDSQDSVGYNVQEQRGSSSYEELMNRMRKKEYKARLTRVPLQITDDLEIDVQVCLCLHIQQSGLSLL